MEVRNSVYNEKERSFPPPQKVLGHSTPLLNRDFISLYVSPKKRGSPILHVAFYPVKHRLIGRSFNHCVNPLFQVWTFSCFPVSQNNSGSCDQSDNNNRKSTFCCVWDLSSVP